MGKKKGKESEAPPKDEFDPLELVTKRPQTVVLMLQSPEENILQLACEALFKFAEKCDENKEKLLELGVLDYLLGLMTHEDKVIKRNTAMCIGTMATNSAVRKVLKKSSCIPSLVSLIGPEEDVLCHEFGTLALACLAEDFSSKLDIFEQGGLEPLITLLSSHDCDVQKNAVQAIALLVQEFQSRAAIQELNGIEPLLKLLDSDYPIIQELALTALIRCTHDADNRIAVRELNGLDKLVDMIGIKDMDDLHVLCLQVLANCLEDNESLQAIQSTGVFDKLLAFIAESPVPEVQQYAATVIAACAKNVENRKLFHEQETEKTLITLLAGESTEVSTSAAKALGIMSENMNSRDTIGKLDGIPPLISLLKNESPEAREAASLALANLSSANTNNCSEIMEKGGVDPLIKLLSDCKSAVQGNAAVCLTNLAQDEQWRSDMLRAGVVTGLVNALQSSDTDAQNKACLALSAFIPDAEGRNEVQHEGALPLLVNLLKSNHEGVRRSASWAIMMCCVDHQISSEVTKLGGLTILQKLNLSDSRRSPFTEAALDRILDSNLSAKYSLTGILREENIITDGFYDAGKMAPGTQFPSLEELNKLPVDQRRPIILINSSKNQQRHGANVPSLRVDQVSNPSGSSTPLRTAKSRSETRGKSRQSNTRDERKTQADDESNKSKSVKKSSLPRKPHVDEIFSSYVEEVHDSILPLPTTRDQVETLARFVSDNMGGSVLKDDMASFSFELPISQLKTEMDSNVIPIGKIKFGIYYHRALLFKALSDRIGLSCSLIRGDYGRAWNEIRICEMDKPTEPKFPPKAYVVDLMHEPGSLLAIGSPEAAAYQRI